MNTFLDQIWKYKTENGALNVFITFIALRKGLSIASFIEHPAHKPV